jgi:hypothetical protein
MRKPRSINSTMVALKFFCFKCIRPVFDPGRRPRVVSLSDARRPDAIRAALGERSPANPRPIRATRAAARSHAQALTAEHGERG